MKTLILMRHAKSAWDTPADGDHGRPLNPRGRATAPKVGAWLVRNGYVPTEALVSDAARTRETWALTAAAFPAPVAVSFHRDLYLAEPEVMLALAAQTTADVVMMVAHNPGTAELAWQLADTPPRDVRFESYPTGAVTVLEFADEIAVEKGRVVDFLAPRDLD